MRIGPGTLFYPLAARRAAARGALHFPRMLTLNVTSRCNAKCPFCKCSITGDKSTEMTTAHYQALAASDAGARIGMIRVTGGEPFLREDLDEIISAFASQCPALSSVYITTNGSFPDRVKSVVESFAAIARGRMSMQIQVSLDALDRDINDSTRGVKGITDRVFDTLAYLRTQAGNPRIGFGINQTITSSNLQHVEEMAGFAAAIGASHHFFLSAMYHEGKTGFMMHPGKAPAGFVLQDPSMSREDLELFYSLHAHIKREPLSSTRGNITAFLRSLSEEYLNEGGRNRALAGIHSPAPPCLALTSFARVSPEGDIYPCTLLRHTVAGNVTREDAGAIWTCSRMAEARAAVASCAGCWIECDINPSAFYSGDVLGWYLRKIATDASFRKAYFPPRLR